MIAAYGIRAPSPQAPIGVLSGGNVQRCVLARELDGDVRLLIVANPCFGLDVKAVAETRARIMAARNAGTAVLLISEDLDEILELADRIVVMREGSIVGRAARCRRRPAGDRPAHAGPWLIPAREKIDVWRPNSPVMAGLDPLASAQRGGE